MYDELTKEDIQKMQEEIDYRVQQLRPKVICKDGSVHDLLLHVRGLTADEKEILLDGCLMNYYAKRI